MKWISKLFFGLGFSGLLALNAHADERYIWSDAKGLQSSQDCQQTATADSPFRVQTVAGKGARIVVPIADVAGLADTSGYVISIRSSFETRLTGTYMQPSMQGNLYMALMCGESPYMLFEVFATDKNDPIAEVGVSPLEMSLFKGARAMTVVDATDAVQRKAQSSGIQPSRIAAPVVPSATQPSTLEAGAQTEKATTTAKSEPKSKAPAKSTSAPKPAAKSVAKATPEKPVPAPAASEPASKPATTAAANPATAPAGDDGDEAKDVQHAAPWSKVGGSLSWTRAALEMIHKRKASLDKARDVETFCRGYHGASSRQQDICWIRIIGGIMTYESAFKPRSMMRENNGTYSVGLMAMSAAQCSNAPSNRALQDPIKNIDCGINEMANLIAAAGYISGPGDRGAAQNWSTLRSRRTVFVAAAGRNVSVGFKAQVESIAMKFSSFR